MNQTKNSENSKMIKRKFHIILVDSIDKLKSFAQNILKNDSIIGIDVESDRNHRYGHNLSLIQVGTKKSQYLLDPLSLSTSKEEYDANFSAVLKNRSLKKLFYAGVEDIQVLKREFSGQITNVYDVQTTHSLAIHGTLNHMVGLDKLIKKEFNHQLPPHVSKLQRTDWSKRPLTRDMQEYAALDVLYLIDLYEKYIKILQTQKDYPYYQRYFEALELVEPVNEEIAEIVKFMKIYNFDTLSPHDLFLVYRIHLFRMKVAKKINRPSHFILSKQPLDRFRLRRLAGNIDERRIFFFQTIRIHIGH